ncbi:hypothetical protein [Simiduia aestuariiviva]|uniref:Matrixin family metalloprotease n=1 Tax=Simiduia aestuariiviva TaxID=1510459 RepID=A0A839UTA2_9GAMM|nr:hypothetical protein [Simiduia aestuariiviva]MBB3169951.1 hypothetical protein [Simiduia aestuariiviva]
MSFTRKLVAISALSTLAVLPNLANADHAWSNYHWATTTGTVNLPVVDSVTQDWQASFETSLSKWNQSNHINQTVVSADDNSRTRKRCPSVTGQMRVCNAYYGNNGWAGLASINLDSNGHIKLGVAKMNDTYMASDTTANRNHVMCQEIGHVFGLGHTSEDGSSQNTCMDYSNSNNSQWPNSHDYAMLAQIYNHTDGYDSAGGSSDTCKGKKCASKSPKIKVMQKGRMQIWVSPGDDDSLWVHHIWLAPGFEDIVHDHE